MARRGGARRGVPQTQKLRAIFLPRDLTRHDFFDHKPNIRRPSTDVVLLLLGAGPPVVMPRQSPALFKLAAALALAICAGCAVSEPIDYDGIAKQRGTGIAGSSAAGTSGSGAAGADVSGIGGSTAGSATTGTGGTFGSAGAAGSGKVNITSGQAGDGTTIVTGGTGGGNVSGQAGAGGSGDSTGIAGRGGTTGSAGRGGTTGSAGRGGATGSAGRGGTTGSAGRGGTGGSSIDAGTNPDGAAAATFTEIYTTILTMYCAGASCHSPGAAAGISFASKSSAYDSVLPRVVPGNGANSSFYKTVNSGSMPRGAAKLSAANLARIKAWIDAGALDN
jgi:hypothetical protein